MRWSKGVRKALVGAVSALCVAAPASAQRYAVDVQWTTPDGVISHCADLSMKRTTQAAPSRLIYSVHVVPMPERNPTELDVRIVLGEPAGLPNERGSCGTIGRISLPPSGGMFSIGALRIRVQPS